MARTSSEGEVAIFWDFGSCPAPSGSQCTGYAVAHSIRTLALRLGVIKLFKGYLAVSPGHSSTTAPALALRSELQSSGVSLTDVPGGKDVADKMLLVDMLSYAFDRQSSSKEETFPTLTLVLITADPSFAYGLSILRMRNNHRIALMSPPANARCLPLISQATLCLEWPWDNSDGAAATEGMPATNVSSSAGGTHCPSIKTRQNLNLEDMTNLISRPSSAHPCHRNESSSDISAAFPSRSARQDMDDDAKAPSEPGGPESSDAVERTLFGADTGAEGQSKKPSYSQSSGTSDTRASSSSPNPPINIQVPDKEKPPSYAHSHTPPKHGLKPTLPPVEGVSKPLTPLEFTTIVEVLRLWRSKGHEQPLRSDIALAIVTRDREVYAKAGTDSFAKYTSKAKKLGLIKLGGGVGTAWISLQPAYY